MLRPQLASSIKQELRLHARSPPSLSLESRTWWTREALGKEAEKEEEEEEEEEDEEERRRRRRKSEGALSNSRET